jgi:PTH1 family peptidyl-tRNA hydrolase
VHWVLKKPSIEQRQGIEDSIIRSVKALAQLLSGDMEKAMVQIHTSKPPRPKPPKPLALQVPPSAEA